MKRITYTSKPELFKSCLRIVPGMHIEMIEEMLRRFEHEDNCELVVYYTLHTDWRVAVCNNYIVYGFHDCAFDSFELHLAMSRGTPF